MITWQIDWICPIQFLFGIPCPGCNMLTALYWLVKGNFALSFQYHAMLVPTLALMPLLLIKKWRQPILIFWCAVMILYYIWRMICFFPDFPMVFEWNSLAGFLLERFA
jgi:uncharacterized membrane protein